MQLPRAMCANTETANDLDTTILVVTMTARSYAAICAALQVVIDMGDKAPGGGEIRRDLMPILASLGSDSIL